MADDTAKVMEALQYVRRHTANAQVLLVCDALSKRMHTKPASADPVISQPPAADVTSPAGLACPVCEARRKAHTATMAKARSRAAKGKRKGKSKPPLSPVIQTKNNAPASSSEASPPVTHRQQSTPE